MSGRPQITMRRSVPALLAAASVLLAAVPASATAHRLRDARVLGSWAMVAHVTAAVLVPGEHQGQVLHRTWSIVPSRCRGSVCRRLVLVRRRSAGKRTRTVLDRIAPGRYAGTGAFFVGLSCVGRVYPRAGRVPYRITLTVTRSTLVEGIRFARRIRATYSNPRRSDATPCPLGPSHDAARYSGRAIAAVPGPPTAQFTDQVNALQPFAAFTDTSAPGVGGAALRSTAWNFGDPASGGTDTSSQPDPAHEFSNGGTYQVTLSVTDANGLTGTVTHPVVVPGRLLPPASRAHRPAP